MSQKLVSVIIPNYNGLAFIKDTLESVFNQTHKAIELIVIDDGSTDGSLDYLRAIDRPNTIVKPNRTKGACAARNYGLELASGDYIQFLDADDLLSPNKIEAQVKLLEAHPNRIAVCSTVHFYAEPEDGKIADKAFMFSTAQPQDFLLKLYGGDGLNHNMVAQHAWLTPQFIIKKAGPWDEALSKDQDGEYFCRVVMASKGVCYASGVYSYYRKHVGGTNISSHKQRKHLESQFQALNSKSWQFRKLCRTNAFHQAMALQYKILAIDAYPEYKDICHKCITISKGYGGSFYVPVLGGKIIECIKYVFGWRTAKAISVFVHRHIKKY